MSNAAVCVLLVAEAVFVVVLARNFWPVETETVITRYVDSKSEPIGSLDVVYFAYDPDVGIVYGPAGAPIGDGFRIFVEVGDSTGHWFPVTPAITIATHQYRISVMKDGMARSMPEPWPMPKAPIPPGAVATAWKECHAWRRVGRFIELDTPEGHFQLDVTDWAPPEEKEI